MSHELFTNPLHDDRGMTVTVAHLVILALTGLALLLGQLDLPPSIARSVGQLRRVMFLLLGMAFMYHLTVTQLRGYQKRLQDQNEAEAKLAHDTIMKETVIDKKKSETEWDSVSAHPSRFLTTKDGKPRLFPFPLGKAGGSGRKGDLWWEAGNSAHVGHFNQKDSPEARQKLRWDIEDKEEERLKKAKAAWKAYDDNRKKWWIRRLSNLKLVALIVVLGLISRTAAVVALAALIYYVLITELSSIMANDLEEKPKKAAKRKETPNTPGMAMTYLYEPTGGGDVQDAGAIPVSAPSNRLMTSTSTKLAS